MRHIVICGLHCSTVFFHGRLCLKCDGTRAETRFRLSAKRTSPFTSAGASFQSNTCSRGVRISGSNVGYTKFRGSEGYWLPTTFASFPFTSPPVRVPPRFNWNLPGAFNGGKSGRWVRLATLPPSWAVVMKSGNVNSLEPSGPLQACKGTALTF